MSFRIVRVLALGLAFVASLASGQTNNFNVLDGSPLKATTVQVGDGTAAAPSYSFASASNTGWFNSSGALSAATAGSLKLQIDSAGNINTKQSASLNLGGVDGVQASLFVDAASTLAQRNGVNAQTFRLYNTYTDASNYERGALQWYVNAFQLTTQNLGTGVAREISIYTGGLANLYFGTNSISRWYVSSSGPFMAFADNAYDIGAAGANRPRNIYAGSAIFTTAPNTQTGAAYTVLATDNYLIANAAATQTLTLPTASTNTGRLIRVKTIAAFTVVSASSNVVPLAGGAAGTAILAATAGKWADLVSDGTNWVIMAGN